LGLSEGRRTVVESSRETPRSRATGSRREVGPSGSTGRTSPGIRTRGRTLPPNRRTRCTRPSCCNRCRYSHFGSAAVPPVAVAAATVVVAAAGAPGDAVVRRRHTY